MMGDTVKLVYFAWVRERVGRPDEEIALPASVHTPADLMAHLAAADEGYAAAFAEPTAIRVALDKRVAEPDASLAGVREIAFFPPMTGG